MKKKEIFKILLLTVGTTFVFQACKKDEGTTPDQGSDDKGSEVIEELFGKNAPKAMKVTFKAEDGGFINGTKTEIFVSANSLVDKDGNAITGDVDFEMTEFLSKGDMAFSGVTTVSGDNMIESAGMFNLEVSQNGEEVFLADGESIEVEIIQDDFPQNQFQLFDGQEDGDEDNNDVDWQPLDSAQQQRLQAREDSMGTVSFKFNYFKFGYCNIDRFFNDFFGNEISSFRINMPSGYNGENSWALLLFEDYKSCAWTYWDRTHKLFSTSYKLGKGVKCKVLVVSVLDADKKEFEYEVQDITLVDNTVVEITNLQPITEAQIEAIVKAL